MNVRNIRRLDKSVVARLLLLHSLKGIVRNTPKEPECKINGRKR